MKSVNATVSSEETAKIMQEFAVQNEKMAFTEEMMDDALIDAVSASPTPLRLLLFFLCPGCFHAGSGSWLAPVATHRTWTLRWHFRGVPR